VPLERRPEQGLDGEHDTSGKPPAAVRAGSSVSGRSDHTGRRGHRWIPRRNGDVVAAAAAPVARPPFPTGVCDTVSLLAGSKTDHRNVHDEIPPCTASEDIREPLGQTPPAV